MARAVGLKSKLITFVMERPGRLITIDELEKGLGPEFERSQLVAGMNHVIYKDTLPGLVRKVAGQVWRYDPRDETADVPDGVDILLEHVRDLGDGSALYADADGSVYKVVKVA